MNVERAPCSEVELFSLKMVGGGRTGQRERRPLSAGALHMF